MSVITTSTAATATAYSNQRKIDRTSNGVLWAVVNTGSNDTVQAELRYSTDDGATWASGGTLTNGSQSAGLSYAPKNLSFFIDQDDYAHVVFKDASNGYIYYRRGTPNAARTAWTWSAAVVVYNGNTGGDYPDIVAHREGTGWSVHIVFSINNNAAECWFYYANVPVSSAGAIGAASLRNNGYYTVNAKTYPSIDFNHTGDGKTVAGGTPHLYVAWSAGATGAGKGIRFRKATYSGGSWTWGTEREIDSARYVLNSSFWLNCLFDGTRVVMAGLLRQVGTTTTNDLVIYERDAADTATTTRPLIVDVTGTDMLFNGSSSCDGSGNVYLIGRDYTDTSAGGTNNLVYRKWTRSSATLDSSVILDSAVGVPYASAKRGHSNNRIEYVYTDGTASPYSVTYGSVLLNNPPSVSITSHAGGEQFDPRLPLTIDYSYTDADGDPQMQREYGWRVVGGTWNTTTASTASASFTIPKNTIPDVSDIEVRVRAYDGKGWGDYDTVSLRADSWTCVPEEVTAVQSGSIDATTFDQAMEVEVRTADAVGYGPWSKPYKVEGEQVLVWTGTAWAYIGTAHGYDAAWEGNKVFVNDGTQFKPTKVR